MAGPIVGPQQVAAVSVVTYPDVLLPVVVVVVPANPVTRLLFRGHPRGFGPVQERSIALANDEHVRNGGRLRVVLQPVAPVQVEHAVPIGVAKGRRCRGIHPLHTGCSHRRQHPLTVVEQDLIEEVLVELPIAVVVATAKQLVRTGKVVGSRVVAIPVRDGHTILIVVGDAGAVVHYAIAVIIETVGSNFRCARVDRVHRIVAVPLREGHAVTVSIRGNVGPGKCVVVSVVVDVAVHQEGVPGRIREEIHGGLREPALPIAKERLGPALVQDDVDMVVSVEVYERSVRNGGLRERLPGALPEPSRRFVPTAKRLSAELHAEVTVRAVGNRLSRHEHLRAGGLALGYLLDR